VHWQTLGNCRYRQRKSKIDLDKKNLTEKAKTEQKKRRKEMEKKTGTEKERKRGK
jgi:hypothetical protein